MSYPLYLIDTFTNKMFGGNSAGVCLLDKPGGDDWMRHVAAEVNAAETAFFYPANGVYNLRWFTPTVEVDLCGHATLATAHVLWTANMLDENQPASFDTKSGRLTARKRGEWIDLNFPAMPAKQTLFPDAVVAAVGVRPVFTGRSIFDILLEVETEAEVVAAEPNFDALRKIPEIRGVIVTARSLSGESDFVSRFFAPAVGIDEDPATGSSHCCLAPYWSAKIGRDALTGRQLSKRGGVVKTLLLGDRVQLSGQAVTVFMGSVME